MGAGEYDTAQQLFQRYRKAREQFNQASAEIKQKSPKAYALLPLESEPAKQYLHLLDTQFTPAMERRDWQAVLRVQSELATPLRQYEQLMDESEERLRELVHQNESDAMAQVNNSKWQLAAVALLALLTMVAIGFVCMRQILASARAVRQVARQMAQGDLTARAALHTRDELGQMAQDLNRAIESLAATMRRAVQTAESVVQSAHQTAQDLNQVAHGAQQMSLAMNQSAQGTEQMTHEIQRSADNLNTIRAVADEATRGAAQTARAAQDGVVQIQEVARVVQEVARGAQQMLAGTETASTALNEIAAIAEQSSAGAQQMLASLEQATASMGQMAALSEEVAAGAEEVNATVQDQANAVAAINERMQLTTVSAQQLIEAIRLFKIDDEQPSSAEDVIVLYPAA